MSAALEPVAVVARYAAVVVLVGIALLHVGWALGSSFPAASRESLARHVIGVAPRGGGMPGRFATWVVALGLVGVAGCVVGLGFRASPSVAWALRAVALTFVGIFALRGMFGFFEVALRPAIRDTPYMRWSRAIYSPLSLLLAALIAVGAQA